MFLTTRKTLNKFAHGFTLIELLIVIAIMGILAAAVLIAINPVKRQATAKDANVQSDISGLATAAQAYYTQLGYYPAAANDLTTSQDIKTVPTPPSGGTGGANYTFIAKQADGTTACTTAAGDCKTIQISYPMFWPATAGNLWCFQGGTGKPAEKTVAQCVPS